MSEKKSVDLSWLEDYCEKRLLAFPEPNGDYGRGVRKTLEFLLSAVRAKAKEEVSEDE